MSLLEEKEAPKSKKTNRTFTKKNQSVEKENVQSKSRGKIINQAEARRI